MNRIRLGQGHFLATNYANGKVGSQQLAVGKNLFSVFTFIIAICLLLFALPLTSAPKTRDFDCCQNQLVVGSRKSVVGQVVVGGVFG